MTDDLRYPIGPFIYRPELDEEKRSEYLERLRTFPERLEAVAAGLTEEQLDRPYRPGGWTARQVIHHVVDSHLNAYVRTKWTLTENTPVIKAYDEVAWAELPDTRKVPIAVSLSILKPFHARWTSLLDALDPVDWQRAFFHPERGQLVTLAELLANYAWHGDHHLAHVHLVAG